MKKRIEYYIAYAVRDLKSLNEVIIPHFNLYPLISQKQEDYLIFKKIVEQINNKQHLNKNGFINILKLKIYYYYINREHLLINHYKKYS